jgi:hypothetical protein
VWLTNDPAVLFGTLVIASGGLDVIAEGAPPTSK